VAKHRNGPVGVVRMFFDEQRVSFKNLDKGRTVPAALPMAAAMPAPPLSPPPAPQF
jgi:hypothetical protein